MRILLAVAMALGCWDAVAATASGVHWRLSVESIECDSSRLQLGTRIRYAGPKGVVEAPVMQLMDSAGRVFAPKSLVWKSGSKPLAAWLSAGGLRNLQSEYAGEIQWRFEVQGASGELRLEFGDLRAFSLGACGRLRKPPQIQVPHFARAENPRPLIRVYRNRYPCKGRAAQSVEAQYPPYLPRQLLVFGRGYLPNARQIELPMGKAAAQSYAYFGADDLKAVEDAAQRAIASDFAGYGSAYFAFNWGVQKAASGNEVYSIGIYSTERCPK